MHVRRLQRFDLAALIIQYWPITRLCCNQLNSFLESRKWARRRRQFNGIDLWLLIWSSNRTRFRCEISCESTSGWVMVLRQSFWLIGQWFIAAFLSTYWIVSKSLEAVVVIIVLLAALINRTNLTLATHGNDLIFSSIEFALEIGVFGRVAAGSLLTKLMRRANITNDSVMINPCKFHAKNGENKACENGNGGM